MGRGPVQAHARHDIRRHSPYDHTGSTPDKEVDGRGLDTVENREMGSPGGTWGRFFTWRSCWSLLCLYSIVDSLLKAKLYFFVAQKISNQATLFLQIVKWQMLCEVNKTKLIEFLF
jgi:hypothetical protein